MKTIAILSQKGGAGKTTLALHLAVAAELAGQQTAVIDIDPQASATSWGDSRSKEAPVIVSAQPARLPAVLQAAQDADADLAIIDTAPHSESASLAAARAADLVLIPCRPAILDLRAIGSTIDLVRLAKAKACIVLNAVPPVGSLGEDAKAAVEHYKVAIAPVWIRQRVAFQHALTAGQAAQEYEPQGKASAEVSELYQWVCDQVGMSS